MQDNILGNSQISSVPQTEHQTNPHPYSSGVALTSGVISAAEAAEESPEDQGTPDSEQEDEGKEDSDKGIPDSEQEDEGKEDSDKGITDGEQEDEGKEDSDKGIPDGEQERGKPE